MPNPKPLAEAELPKVPNGCGKYNAPLWPTFEQHWFLSVDLNENTIDFGPNDAAKLCEVAAWLELANGIEPQKSEAPSGDAEKRIAAIFGAWLLDRAEQYRNDSCCRCVFDELIEKLRQGEPWEAYRHGELDDILKTRSRALPSLLRPAAVVKPRTDGKPPNPANRPKGFT